MHFQALLAGALLLATCAAAAPAIKLKCGTVTGFKSEAEWKSVPSQGINTVDVTFIGAKPSSAQIDRSLRDCAEVAIKRDSNRDILVSAWFRQRPTDNPRDDDLLRPYGSLKYLSYDARSRTVAVREMKLQKK